MGFVDYPFWAIKARFGFRQVFRMSILHDEDVDVYVATSEDFPGLICEADTRDELIAETERVFQDVLTYFVKGRNPTMPVLEWPAS